VTACAAVGFTGGRVLAMQVFPSELRALSTIRDFVEKWGREVGLSEEQRYGMKLAVSEACANAMEHPEDKSDLTLWAWDRGDRFTVDLWHAGEFRVKPAQDRGHRGMGLPLIVACVDEAAFACLPEGGTRVSLSMFLKVGPPPGLQES
jgi:anti-sigma regulatory factor (Ser/Thr protein kinase)